MNKRLLKVLEICKYIIIGVLTAVVTHWICGGGFFESFIIGEVTAIAGDLIDVKYDD